MSNRARPSGANEIRTPKVTWTELRPMRVSVACNCGGEMKVRNSVKPGIGPVEYRHECTKCGASEWYADAYPDIVYATVSVSPTPADHERGGRLREGGGS